jgi:hypothetical protein
MNDSEKLTKIEEHIAVNAVYYMNLLLDKNLPEFKRTYLEGQLNMLRKLESEFFNGKARIDF